MTITLVSHAKRSAPNEGGVLIVSDRMDSIGPLAHRVRMALECSVAAPTDPMPRVTPAAIVLDVAADTTLPNAGPLALALASTIPLLILRRDQDTAPASRFGTLNADANLPAGSPLTMIVGTLLRMINLRHPRIEPTANAHRSSTSVRAAEACGLVSDILEAAATDGPLPGGSIDAGAEVVLTAVGDSGIRAWLDTIWSYDDNLYQHVLSVTGYAAAFSKALGFSAADRLRLAKAALLHDVGKTRIPRSILDKPGRLDAAEMAIMREHPAIGAELLARQFGFDASMIDVVRHHHEMLDGSGYPDGLSGADIGHVVRLVTICDIYSALTERRPYRRPISGSAAYEHLEGMTGKIDGAILSYFRPVHEQASTPCQA